MSTSWMIHCTDCDTNLTVAEPRPSKGDLAAMVRHAGALANLAPLFRETEYLEMKDLGQYIEPKDFEAHRGHKLVLQNEYGDVEEVGAKL